MTLKIKEYADSYFLRNTKYFYSDGTNAVKSEYIDHILTATTPRIISFRGKRPKSELGEAAAKNYIRMPYTVIQRRNTNNELHFRYDIGVAIIAKPAIGDEAEFWHHYTCVYERLPSTPRGWLKVYQDGVLIGITSNANSASNLASNDVVI